MTLLGWDTSHVPTMWTNVAFVNLFLLDLWIFLAFTHHHVLRFLLSFCFAKFQRGNFSHYACRIDEAPRVFLLKGYSLSLMSITTVERTAANYCLMPGCLTLEADVCSSAFKMQVNRQPPLYFIRFSFANISPAERCDSLKGVSEHAFSQEG